MRSKKIYVLSLDTNEPVGGVKKQYQHVDILNKNGFEAYILHAIPGFRCTWFKNETKIAYWLDEDWNLPHWRKRLKRIIRAVPKTGHPKRNKIYFDKHSWSYLTPDDYLVLHEGLGPKMLEIEPGVKKIIFNQNAYFSFNGYSFNTNNLTSPYCDHSGDLVGVISISDDNEQYLRYVFPNIKCFRLRHPSRDPRVFSFSERKKKQICFMPRKRYEDALQVINILKFRAALKDWNIKIISGRTQEEVAQIMKESLIFLSFGYPEGSPLPPTEAMLCGCIVIGYHGNGGQEYFMPEFSYPIALGDIIGFASTTERIMREWEANPQIFETKTRQAAEFIRNRYSPEKEEEELVSVWKQILEEKG